MAKHVRGHRLTSSEIRLRADMLKAAGHPRSPGRPRDGDKPSVLTILQAETGLSRVVLHRILRGDRTRGGKKTRNTTPAVRAAPALEPTTAMAMAYQQAGKGWPSAQGETETLRQRIRQLQEDLVLATHESQDLRDQLEAHRRGLPTSVVPGSITPFDPLHEAKAFQETAEALVRDPSISPRMRLILQHYLVEVEKLSP